MGATRTTFQREVDDKLTGEFNGQLPVRQFLLTKIAELTAYLEGRYGGDVRMFIKGGSALSLLTEAKTNNFGSASKWSDFDNQIIINPNLPIKQWYDILFEIHNYFKHEYLPTFQKQWDLFLACNRKELDEHEQRGLDFFRGQTISHDIFDFPRFQFKLDDDKCDVKTAYQVQSALEVDYQPLELTLENTSQSNMVFSAGMSLMHPLNHFDNAMSLSNTDSQSAALKEAGIQADELFYNQFFPPTPAALDENEAVNEAPNSSSILINTSIAKFVLYRVIVRYSSHDYYSDGKKKDLGKKQWFDSSQKAFDKPFRAKFRGELLDVSIPRRDSEETIAQWQQVNTSTVHYFPITAQVSNVAKENAGDYIGNILSQKQKGHWLNLPDWDYQLNENILLILEVFIRISGSPHKFWKRATRAADAVESMYLSYSQAQEFNATTYANRYMTHSFIKTKFIEINDTIRFVRPLVHNLDEVLYSDYLWQYISDDERLNQTVDGILGGGTLLEKINANWDAKKGARPNGDNKYDTFEQILNDKVENQQEKTRCQQILGFMQIYYDMHKSHKQTLAFETHIVTLNNYRHSLELKLNVSVSFCGLLSSAINGYAKVGAGDGFDYYYPFVELFVIGNQQGLTVNDFTGLAHTHCVKKTLATRADRREKDYFVLSITNFPIPVIIWSFNKPHRDYGQEYQAILDALDSVSNRIKDLTAKIQNIQQNLNSEHIAFMQDTRQQMLLELADLRENKAQMRQLQKEHRRAGQILQVFNNVSTQLIAKSNGDPYRLLKQAEAIKHIDSKIADTKSFYLTHWLDHARCHYKSLITRF